MKDGWTSDGVLVGRTRIAADDENVDGAGGVDSRDLHTLVGCVGHEQRGEAVEEGSVVRRVGGGIEIGRERQRDAVGGLEVGGVGCGERGESLDGQLGVRVGAAGDEAGGERVDGREAERRVVGTC